MPRQRKDILPGAGTDSFFDGGVQKVLETRRAESRSKFAELSPAARREALAWPIIAYHAAENFSGLWGDFKRQPFWDAYLLDPVFMADLLAQVSRYHHLPKSEWSVARRVAELSNVSVGTLDLNASEMPKPDLLSWIDVADLDNPNKAKQKLQAGKIALESHAENLKREFSDEKTARKKLLAKWRSHFTAHSKLDIDTKREHLRLLPLRNFPPGDSSLISDFFRDY